MTSTSQPYGAAGDRAVSPTPVVLDGGDARCVLLLTRLARLITELRPGSVVHVIATDPAAPLDLPAWCHLTGHLHLGPVPDRARPTYALQVSGQARGVDLGAPWRPGS
ncbi:sulfurtransferase TusA family protein [Streptosporangium sp. NPDC002544]|uniref:sulfurtransferase TusA family protein n=1 Tax=Streptosporangium sp. NPDC002544 TaxID=3154538 RepID=UPI00331B4C14